MRLFLQTKQVEVIDHVATGALVRRLRMMNNLSLRSVARKLKVSAVYVSDLEWGKRNWTQTRLDRCVRTLEAMRMTLPSLKGNG